MNHLEVMERRNKSLPTDLYGYKTGGMAPYGLDVLIPDKLDFDESRMSMSLPFADGRRRDGVGDLLEVGGIRTERHQKNAIVLFDHGKRLDLPIAMAWEWDNKAGKYDTSKYTVNIDPVAKTASLNAFFYQGKGVIPGEEGSDRSRVSDHGLLCEQYYDLAVKGLLRGGSIGYQVVKALQLQPDYEQGLPQGLHLLSTTMLEGSLVVLPANMDTVQKMLSMPTCCGKPLSPYLIKSLQPYAPSRRKAQMGYEGKARHSEAMEARKALGQQPSIKSPSAHVGGNRLNRNNSVPGPGGYVPPNWKPGVGAMPQKSSGAIRNAKSLALRAKYGTSQKSIQAKEILSKIETKSLKDLRLKHRQVKGTRRKVKNTEHGSSILYVSGRDLEKVRNLAKDKGVTCKLLGTHHTGAEKVHLFGDDSIIDEISMQYGRPLKMFKGRGIKAIIVSNTKDGEGLKRIKAHRPGDKFKLGESVYEVTSEGTNHKVPAKTVSGPAHNKSPGKRVFPRCPDTGHVSTGSETVQFENVPKKGVKARYPGERFRFTTESEGDPQSDVFEVIEPSVEEKETGEVPPEYVAARTVSGRRHEATGGSGRFQFHRDPHTGHATTTPAARAAGVGFTDVPTPPRKPRFPPEENKKIKALRKKYGKKKQIKAVRHPEDSNRWVQRSS